MKAAEQLNPASLLNLMAFSIVLKGSICPIVGLGDFIFIGIYFIALRQIGAGSWAQFIIPTAGSWCFNCGCIGGRNLRHSVYGGCRYRLSIFQSSSISTSPAMLMKFQPKTVDIIQNNDEE